jgi:ubiquinone/menaquinone biosynthesis C-methylase UbiE
MDKVRNRDKYFLIGPIYDWLGQLYSGGAIHQSKMAMLTVRHIQPGDKYLFAGAGQGKDAIQAAILGAVVTVVDISPTMLSQFKKQVKAAQPDHPDLEISAIHGDILEHSDPEKYDAVVINFFLNVFNETTMQAMLNHLILQTRPGGRVIVGDFNYPTGSRLSRWIFLTYWSLAIGVFWLTTKNALHKIYDYQAILTKSGLELVEKKTYRFLGMDCCAALLYRRPPLNRDS